MARTPRATRTTRGARTTLAARTTLVTATVVVVAILLVGLVSLGLVRGASQSQALLTLGRQADLVARSVDRSVVVGAPQRPLRLEPILRQQGISLHVLRTGGSAPAGLTPAQVARVLAGHPVSVIVTVGGRSLLIAARPTDSRVGIALVQSARVARSTAAQALGRLGLALMVGLAGGVLSGLALSRWLARPLARTAQAAHRLSTGERGVRVEPDGPVEVAEVAEAINTLSAALALSEDRQRELLLSVSHELRTPLTAVKGYAEALADGVVPATEVASTGRTMLAESERLERLVRDLLDLARLGAQDFRLDLSPTDVVELVRLAGVVWADRGRRAGVPVRVELPDGPLVVRTDPTRVRQIVDGLAENALRVTPPGRPVVLAVRAEARPGHLGSAITVPVAVLEVRDGGPGLTEDDIGVAFERSALYDRYRGVRRVGTGVGLALVAGLATRLGGAAQAGTAAEGGASFRVVLPAD
ncbi:MAG: sensor histidine kinase [Actinomycetes bacterium]